MKRVIEYAYTGHLEITVDNAQDLLGAANLFQYQAIVDACCEFLSRHLHPSNCLGIENFAHMHACSKLETEAHLFVLDNFSSVVEYEEFIELSPERLISYIASDHIDVRVEETVYEASLKWIQHDEEKRKHLSCSIMEHIRFATVDVQYMEDKVENDAIVRLCENLLQPCRRCQEVPRDEDITAWEQTSQHAG